MHTPEEMAEIVNKYAICMQEVKLRTEAVCSILKKQTTTLYPYTNAEFLCLQIRKILELIVMANLVANKNEYQKIREKFATDWNAKRIIETIKKVNENYFPKPIYRKSPSIKKAQCEWVEKTTDILNENLYIDIYNKVSNLLHSQNPFNDNKINIDEINKDCLNYINLIINTLNEHNTELCNKNIVNCTMNAIEPQSKQKKVSVHYFGKVTESYVNEVLNEQNS